MECLFASILESANVKTTQFKKMFDLFVLDFYLFIHYSFNSKGAIFSISFQFVEKEKNEDEEEEEEEDDDDDMGTGDDYQMEEFEGCYFYF
jgi:hypothetical protein